jgi:hypothetical protein
VNVSLEAATPPNANGLGTLLPDAASRRCFPRGIRRPNRVQRHDAQEAS